MQSKHNSDNLCLTVCQSLSDEPNSYQEAIESSEASFWIEAMNHEIETINLNETWDTCELPFERTPISCKWVFKKKKESNGNVKYKARLVARGFSQREGIDYFDTYAPVVRFTSLRLLIAYSVKKGLEIYHFDIDSAFLHGELKEEIYMVQPESFVIEGKEN